MSQFIKVKMCSDSVLPEKIDVLSKLWFIKGALIIKNTNFNVVNFTFLNNVRCIENENGMRLSELAIISERDVENNFLEAVGITLPYEYQSELLVPASLD